MRKMIIVVVIILFGAGMAWCAESSAKQSNKEEYKCMCELHPKECAESDIVKLGETAETKTGLVFRIIAEAKLSDSTWFQFLDKCSVGEELDGKCDLVAYLILKSDGFYIRAYTCESATRILKDKCKAKGIKYEDYVHKAVKGD